MVPFSPFHFGVSLLKLNIRKEGTLLIVMGLLGNLGNPVVYVRESQNSEKFLADPMIRILVS